MAKKSNKLLRDDSSNASFDAFVAEFNKSKKMPAASVPVMDNIPTYEMNSRKRTNKKPK